MLFSAVSELLSRRENPGPAQDKSDDVPAPIVRVPAPSKGANVTTMLDFGAVGGFIASAMLVAWVLEWLSLLGLMSLMPLPVRPAPKTVAIASMAGKQPVNQARELRTRP